MVECQPNQNNYTTITSTKKATTSTEIKLQTQMDLRQSVLKKK